MQELSWLKKDNNDTLLIAKVKTRQNEDRFIASSDNLVIKITVPPIQGKANKKIIKLLRKKFKTEIIMESGQTSTLKVFRLKEITPNQILESLTKSS
jgi:uncharacterized protein (TIGR00251 family)